MTIEHVGNNNYVNVDSVRAVGPVQENPPPQGGPTSYTFQILLDGSVLSIGGENQTAVDDQRKELIGQLGNSGFMDSGGFFFKIADVEGIGPITAASVGPGENPQVQYGFDLHLEGNVATLVFNTVQEASASIDAIVAAVNG